MLPPMSVSREGRVNTAPLITSQQEVADSVPAECAEMLWPLFLHQGSYSFVEFEENYSYKQKGACSLEQAPLPAGWARLRDVARR